MNGSIGSWISIPPITQSILLKTQGTDCLAQSVFFICLHYFNNFCLPFV